MEELTPKQARALRAVIAFQTEHGYPPTFQELRDILGLASNSGPLHFFTVLERKGYIERDPYKARALRVIRSVSGEEVDLPVSRFPFKGIPELYDAEWLRTNMEQGIQAWLESEMFPGGSNLTNHVCVVTTPMPSFAHLESLIQEGNNAILLLGFWFEDPPQSEQWWRIGGHYVIVAGVYSDESMIAICDPFIDNAEWGFWGQLEDGRLFPHQHGQHDAAAHNDAGNASRDIYYVDITAAVPIGQWGITEYPISRDPLYWSSNFFNQNVPEEFASNTAQWGGVGTIYTQVEYCVYVSSGDDRGDVNVPYGDGTVDAADVVFLLNYLFRGGDPPVPYIEGDTNCDGTVDPGDVVSLINYLYKGWPPPRCCN